MDEKTLAAYDRHAASFAKEWLTQPPPSDMHALIMRFFHVGPTADVGCGGGRDTAWLSENGFPVVGYDASEGLLAEARRGRPTLRFERASLPSLHGIENDRFTNVLCETVIMHLEHAMIAASVRRLISILKPGGVLYLSWRVTTGADRRDEHGRLYAAFDSDLIFQGLDSADLLLDERRASASSGKLVQRIIARKLGASSLQAGV